MITLKTQTSPDKSKPSSAVPTHKPVTVEIPITILPETPKEQTLIIKEEKPIITPIERPVRESFVSSTEFSNVTQTQTVEQQKFIFEHQTPPILMFESKPKVVHEIPIEVEVKKDEVIIPVMQPSEEPKLEDGGIETQSITKQSSLGFFVSKMKESEEVPAPKPVEVQKLSSNIFSKFQEPPSFSKFESFKQQSEIKEHYVPPIFTAQEYNRQASAAQAELFEEFNLTPEPPPEIGFIPKTEIVKKKEVDERIKKIETTRKDLSPFDVPTGAVKIFPTVQSKQVEDSHITKEEYKVERSYQQQRHEMISRDSELKPILRPQADILTRPLSPRPSAEGVQMEKLWAHRPVTPELKEPVRVPSPLPPSQTATLEKNWTPYKQEYTEHVSSGYTTFKESQIHKPMEPSLQGKEMEKQWAHKHADSHLQKVWPPAQTEEVPKPVVVTTHTEKQWAPVQTRYETSSFSKISSSEVVTPHVPIHYVSNTEVTHIANVIDSSFTKTEHQEVMKEMRNENIIEENLTKPSEIIKSWPPAPVPVERKEPEPMAPQMVRETVPKIDTLPIRPVSVQDITDEVYLEPGPPPEIGYAEAPRERRVSYVESIEQDLEKNLEKEPSRVLPGSVRTMPPPRSSIERTLPPPLPPKKETYQAPPLPMKPVKVETPKFEEFPQLEPFPFKPDPEKPKGSRPPPPPTPSKFIKGRFADSDYESDVEAVRIPAKWKPCQSDTEEPSYRKVKPPKLTPFSRSRSTEPEPAPPSKFDHPPVSYGPPRPLLDLESTKRELKKEFTSTQKIIKQENFIKKETKIHQKRTSPPLKPGSPPEYVHAESPKPKPESPKVKKKIWQESGYMADTDEPLIQKSVHETSSKTEVRHFSQSSESYQRSHSMFESSSIPQIIPQPKALHKHEQKVSSTAMKKVSPRCEHC